MRPEQGIILFLGLPVLFFIAWIVLTILGYKKEKNKYSIFSHLPYQSFEGINPTISYISRVIFILYIASNLPFYIYLFTLSLNYGTSLPWVFGILSLVVLLSLFALAFISYVKMAKPRAHLLGFITFAFLVTAEIILLANISNVLRENHIFGLESETPLFVITIVYACLALSEGVVLANNKLTKWEYLDQSHETKRSYLAFAEWYTIILSLVTLIITVISFFLLA
ncbi:MAG: hypothetical protein MJ238_03335 [Bacilli bacterium]|nr:hypothetical protein [Bacilli bacterium]